MIKYLDAAGLRNLQMKPLKLPKELFLDRIISMEDYQRSSRDQKKLIEQVVDW